MIIVENLFQRNLIKKFRGENYEENNGTISNGIWNTIRGSGY